MPDDDDELAGQLPEGARQHLRKMEKLARELNDKSEQQAKELQQARRELLFARAGIPFGDKQAGYFMKGYDGDESVEAIQSEWAEISGGEPPAKKEQSDEIGTEIARLDRVVQASASAQSLPGMKPEDRLKQDILAATDSDAVIAAMHGHGFYTAEDLLQ